MPFRASNGFSGTSQVRAHLRDPKLPADDNEANCSCALRRFS